MGSPVASDRIGHSELIIYFTVAHVRIGRSRAYGRGREEKKYNAHRNTPDFPF